VGPRPRRVPVRTCVACRQTAGKRELVRVTRSRDGAVTVDVTGRAPGRGAYVHADLACVAEARRRRGLERALRGPVPPEVWDALEAHVAGRPA
jgi:uncharacterized protein